MRSFIRMLTVIGLVLLLVCGCKQKVNMPIDNAIETDMQGHWTANSYERDTRRLR